jgi:hypothetical protein
MMELEGGSSAKPWGPMYGGERGHARMDELEAALDEDLELASHQHAGKRREQLEAAYERTLAEREGKKEWKA